MTPDRGESAGRTSDPLERSFDAVAGDLRRHREELCEILSAVGSQLEPQVRAGTSGLEPADTPSRFFKQMWNRAVDDGSIYDETRLKTLETLGPWLLEIERGTANLREAAQSVLTHLQASRGKRAFSWLRSRPSLTVGQVERSLIGLSQAFQREMPVAMEHEGFGKLTIQWKAERGTAHWNNGSASEPTIDVDQAMCNAVAYHGKVTDEAAVLALVDQLKQDLRDGSLRLPAFVVNCDKSKFGETELNWRLPRGESPPMVFPSQGARFPLPEDLEPDWWSERLELRRLLDEAVCVVTKARCKQLDGKSPGNALELEEKVLEPLVKLILETTSEVYSRSSVVAMLLPFADQCVARVAPGDECRREFERAFNSLASELERPVA